MIVGIFLNVKTAQSASAITNFPMEKILEYVIPAKHNTIHKFNAPNADPTISNNSECEPKKCQNISKKNSEPDSA